MHIQPVRGLITRDDDGDSQHAALHDVPAMIAGEPEIGSPLQVFFDSGKVMRTTPVQRVAHDGGELIVDTANSRYRLKAAKAA